MVKLASCRHGNECPQTEDARGVAGIEQWYWVGSWHLHIAKVTQNTAYVLHSGNGTRYFLLREKQTEVV